jgi:HSP20 family protein
MEDAQPTTYEPKLAKAGMSPATVKIPTPLKNDEEEFAGEPEGQLTIDVYQTATDIIIESAIAGVDPDDIDVQVAPDSVTIKGSRKRDRVVKDEDYLYQECYWGKFSRSIILPQEIDAENATASFGKNGILRIQLPKLTKAKLKKLKVKLE